MILEMLEKNSAYNVFKLKDKKKDVLLQTIRRMHAISFDRSAEIVQ